MTDLKDIYEIEAIVLSFMISSHATRMIILDRLVPDDFRNEMYKKLFIAIGEIVADKQVVDIYLLDKKVGKFISRDVLQNLSDYASSSVVDLYNLDDYIVQLKNETNRLKILQEVEIFKKETEDTKLIPEKIYSLGKKIQSLDLGTQQNSRTIKEILEDFQDGKPFLEIVKEKMEAYKSHKCLKPEILWGYKKLDSLLQGINRGHLVIIGARPGVGKTTFAINVCKNLIFQNISTLFISLEMSEKEVIYKLMCLISKVPMKHVTEGTIEKEEFMALSEMAKEYGSTKHFAVSDVKIYINDLPNILRKEKELRDIKVVVIDYLGLIDNKKHMENKNQEMAYISRQLKLIAKELDVAIISLAQLSRSPAKELNRLPILTDLRDSGQIEADAEVVMLLHEPDQTQFPKRLTINIGKNRYGSTGETYFTFDKYFGIITE